MNLTGLSSSIGVRTRVIGRISCHRHLTRILTRILTCILTGILTRVHTGILTRVLARILGGILTVRKSVRVISH